MHLLLYPLSAMLIASVFYTLAAVTAAAKWKRATLPSNTEFLPPVTIFKPLAGMDAEAWENFVSFCHLDYPLDRYQLIFGTLDPKDAAIPLVHRLKAEFPHHDITLIAGGDATRGHNRKVCNLLSMEPHAKYDFYLLSDSDMRVKPNYLRRIVAPFKPTSPTLSLSNSVKPTRPVGLVTCPYRGHNPRSLSAKLEALGIGADFIPSAMVSRMLEGVGFAFGSTIALPKSVLEEIGGFEAISDQLADDFRLGEGAKIAGYEVVLSDYVVDNLLGKENFAAMWARRLRWAKTTRSCRPGGYAGAVVTHGVALAALFLIASQFSTVGWGVFAGVLALRLTTSAWIASRYTGDPNILRYLFLLPLSDALSFLLYLSSFVSNRILWRGVPFRLYRGGRLERIVPITKSVTR